VVYSMIPRVHILGTIVYPGISGNGIASVRNKTQEIINYYKKQCNSTCSVSLLKELYSILLLLLSTVLAWRVCSDLVLV